MTNRRKVQIRDLLPTRWLTEYSHLWITGYSIALGTEEEFRNGKTVTLDDAVFIAYWGNLSYFDTSGLSIRFGPQGEFIMDGESKQCELGPGAWLLIFQPCHGEQPKNENELRVRAGALSALLISLTTRNYAYDRVFDNCISIDWAKVSASSKAVLGPHGFPTPKRELLSILPEAYSLIERLEPSDRRRVLLSLHWYDKSMRFIGIDGFISNWIAIETLSMPDTSNIKPVNEALGKAYQLSTAEAAERFGVGRILGLRSRILHDGFVQPIQSHLTDYVCALYEDLLAQKIGMESRRLGEIVASEEFSIDGLFRAA